MKQITLSERPIKKIVGNNIIQMFLVLLTLLIFSPIYINNSILINELLLITPKESNDTLSYIIEIIASVQFQVISRFFTIFFSLYVVSFLLWTISRLDEIIFDSKNKLAYSVFTKAYSYSLYILIFDLLFQSLYMIATKSEIPVSILPYYTGFVLMLQSAVILFNLKVKENKLYLTATILVIGIIIIISLILYFSGGSL